MGYQIAAKKVFMATEKEEGTLLGNSGFDQEASDIKFSTSAASSRVCASLMFVPRMWQVAMLTKLMHPCILSFYGVSIDDAGEIFMVRCPVGLDLPFCFSLAPPPPFRSAFSNVHAVGALR